MKGTRLLLSGYAVFLAASYALGFEPGKQIGGNFASFSVEMLRVLPCAFILIGLFEVWVKRETVERYLGAAAGLRGWISCILLAATAVGGVYVAFPVAHSLRSKGASLGNVFIYLAAAAIVRIPMATFEASFLGIKFTLIRLLVSLPLVIVTSTLLGSFLERRQYKMPTIADDAPAHLN